MNTSVYSHYFEFSEERILFLMHYSVLLIDRNNYNSEILSTQILETATTYEVTKPIKAALAEQLNSSRFCPCIPVSSLKLRRKTVSVSAIPVIVRVC